MAKTVGFPMIRNFNGGLCTAVPAEKNDQQLLRYWSIKSFDFSLSS